MERDDTCSDQALASGSEACSPEALACAMNTTCASCVQNLDEDDDGQCDNFTATCSQFADRFCCIYGDSCSENDLIVDFIGKRWTPMWAASIYCPYTVYGCYMVVSIT